MRTKKDLFDWFLNHAKKYQVNLCEKCMNKDYEKNKTLNDSEWEKYVITRKKNLIAITEDRDENPKSSFFGKIININLDFVCPECGYRNTISRTPFQLFNHHKQLFKWSYELSKYKPNDFRERFEKLLKGEGFK